MSLVGRIPVPTVARTLVDLAAVATTEALELALDDGLRGRLVSVPRVVETLDRLGTRGRRGAGQLARMLEARGVGAHQVESLLELRLLRVLREAGLPEPERQLEILEPGRLVARVDLAYPA